MLKNGINPFILVLLGLFLLFTSGVSADTGTDSGDKDLWKSIEDAYVYCFPLVIVDATMKNRTNTEEATDLKAPVNQLIYNNMVLTADNRVVVSPNVDNIYSSAFLNLNTSAMVFVKPETDRYCSVQFLDAYTNTVDVVGSGSRTGDSQDEVTCLITGRNYEGVVPDGMKQIAIPTDMAWIIIRTVVNGSEDLPNVEAIQDRMLLVPLNVYLSNEAYIPEKGTYNAEYDGDPIDYVLDMSPEEFFSTANNLMVTNPPPSADTAILKDIQSVNVGPALTFDKTILGTDGEKQWKVMLKNLAPALTKQTAEYMISSGDWEYYGDPIGDWGTAYAYRGLVAIKGLGANPTYVAIYPEADTDSQGEQLSGANRYLLHIDKGMLPPVLHDGFWSFTVYGGDNFLIPNEINRYCINDRSNVTYNEDGSLDILLQNEKPDDDRVGNWLPVGTDDFRINMRIYGPDLDKIRSSWKTPHIQEVQVSPEESEMNATKVWDTVKDAYIFSYPLVLMDATMAEHTNTIEPTDEKAPVNQFQHDNQLKNADWRSVVSPNVDTLYSQAFLDLNTTALVFVKPRTDRFCSAQVMDAYSNTIDVVGSGGGAVNPEDEEICLITGRNYEGAIPQGMTHISIPTDMAWIVIRTVCNGPDDLPTIEAIQKQLLLVPVDDYLSKQTYLPPKGRYNAENDFNPGDYVAAMSPEEYFSTANRLMVTNPPAPADAPIREEIQLINVGPGLSFDGTILPEDAQTQWNEMLDSMNPVLSTYFLSFTENLGDWVYYPYPIAEWGTDYPYRAIIAQVAFGANPTYVAIYPETAFDTENRKVTGKNRYILHFDKGMLPPVLQGGFWSVTAYGSDSFLIKNEIDRYCINDRSNVTYSGDGSLDILLQNEKPDDDLVSNWLPIGTDDFHLIMRMYLPDIKKIDGEWAVPEIVKQ
ncbi:MAG: DUF1254 domain-containing protein [Methanospirillaceae archaeon]|nr:DUF1254 domain-containing protein [Methanospirillaceae archaeon]